MLEGTHPFTIVIVAFFVAYLVVRSFFSGKKACGYVSVDEFTVNVSQLKPGDPEYRARLRVEDIEDEFDGYPGLILITSLRHRVNIFGNEIEATPLCPRMYDIRVQPLKNTNQ